MGLLLVCSFWDSLASSTSGSESIDMTSFLCWLASLFDLFGSTVLILEMELSLSELEVPK